jgi:hypothetical protein
VDLIIIDLGENEPVLGMDMEKLDQSFEPIPTFNEFSSSNFEDLLVLANALLATNGVFAILRPLWNKHYDDTLAKAMGSQLGMFEGSKPLLISYERPLYTSNSTACRTREISILRRPGIGNPLKKIKDLGHPMYETDSVRNYVLSENIVKLLHQKRTLRGSRQLAPSFYQQILEILMVPGDAVLGLTAGTSISSLAIFVNVIRFLSMRQC